MYRNNIKLKTKTKGSQAMPKGSLVFFVHLRILLVVPKSSIFVTFTVLFVSKHARVQQIAHTKKFAHAIALVRKFEFDVPTI